ncbi:MAG: hypothetical protein HYV78_00945, partial [Candidatus Wildermuthbacteria bacterium]|nr:hypothetical protein [Candidatus Wildermuthbacteria bacterium]
EGDGGVEKTCFISATSKSSALISDISYGLLSFGIIGRIKRRKKMCTNGTIRKRRSYYTISISGQKYLRQFAEHIGFVSERKCGLLWSASQKKGNTNVDTIPGLAPLFSELYKLFGFQLSNVHDFINIKNGVFNPSPELLRFVCSQIEERILAFKKLGDKLNILGTLPEFQEIAAEARANSALNKTLWHTLGSSWYTAGYKGMPPFCKNALAVIQMTRGLFYSLESIKENIRSGFRATGVHLKHFHPGLQYALVEKAKNDTQYRLIQQSSYFVWQKYQDILLHALPRAEQILHQLKALACADLFWDPIVAIQKTENKKEKYVYDLTVDNEVFVAGRGGMFVHNSYAVKLEILRSLMMGTDVIVLDPENEYKTLSEAVGGSFFDISLSSENHINPFDLPQPREDEKPEDILRSNIINFVGLMRIMLGGLTSEEDSVLDRALAETYAAKDITPES